MLQMALYEVGPSNSIPEYLVPSKKFLPPDQWNASRKLFYKKIDTANQIFDEGIKREALKSIINELIRDNKDNIDKSEMIVDKISDKFAKGVAFEVIFEKLIPVEFGRFAKGKELKVIDRNKIDKAKMIALKIPDEFTRGEALESIVQKLIELHRFDEAREIADKIPGQHNKKWVHDDISKANVKRLIQLRHFSEATKIADKIRNQYDNYLAHDEISEAKKKSY